MGAILGAISGSGAILGAISGSGAIMGAINNVGAILSVISDYIPSSSEVSRKSYNYTQTNIN